MTIPSSCLLTCLTCDEVQVPNSLWAGRSLMNESNKLARESFCITFGSPCNMRSTNHRCRVAVGIGVFLLFCCNTCLCMPSYSVPIAQMWPFCSGKGDKPAARKLSCMCLHLHGWLNHCGFLAQVLVLTSMSKMLSCFVKTIFTFEACHSRKQRGIVLA